jgi:hypothetical protein
MWFAGNLPEPNAARSRLRAANLFHVLVGEPQEVDWKTNIAILESEHRSLRKVVVALVSASPPTLHLIRGAAAHHIYHAGQIRLLRRQQEDSECSLA